MSKNIELFKIVSVYIVKTAYVDHPPLKLLLTTWFCYLLKRSLMELFVYKKNSLCLQDSFFREDSPCILSIRPGKKCTWTLPEKSCSI